jgi:serine/threonine-protein kinase RCK2
VLNVHAHQQQQQKNYDHAPQPQHYANSDPNVMAYQAYQQPATDAYPTADAGAQNRSSQAGNAAAHAAGQNQKVVGGSKGQKITNNELARIVAEEKASKGKLPRYPGLERWRLIEKMGDGAFSNVYRAIDLEGTAGEVAIKVVRKFEMNQNQVR